MRSVLRVIFFTFFLVSFFSRVVAQNATNMGTEFYTAFADHIYTPAKPGTPSQMFLYITSDRSATVQVEVMDGTYSQQYTLLANQVKEIAVPSTAFLGNLSGIKSKQAIHIIASANVSVYAHIYASSVSGATMLIPVSTLGKDYRSVNFTQRSNSIAFNEGKSYSYFTVVATDDNTSIKITSKADIYKDNLIDVNPANTPYIITLNKGDVYQGLSDNDLTATHIQSVSLNGSLCRPIAVFSGSTKLYIGSSISNCGAQTSDNLFQQVYPTTTWGNRFITVPLKGRETQKDIYRVVVSDPNTIISGVPAYQQSDLTVKGYIEFSNDQPQYISADKPIQVVQYAVSQFSFTCTLPAGSTPDVGDPEMIYLNPIDQAIDHAAFYSTGRFAITASYINVVIPVNAISTFRLDGNPLPAGVNFTPVTGNTNFAYAQIPLSTGDQAAIVTATNNGAHYISASKPFNAIAYGFGNIESYGYAAGTSLATLNRSVNLINPATQASIQGSDCSNTGYTPQLTLPYQVGQITWKFDDGTSYIQNNPIVINSFNNSQTIYTYKYFNADKNTALVYFTGGTHRLIAGVIDLSAECGNEDIPFDFSLLASPTAGFTFTNVCLGQGTAFNYTTGPVPTTGKIFDWNFGDGSVHSTDQSPIHNYSTSGDYTVTLTVNNANGCAAVSSPQIVHISRKPLTTFTVSAPDCATSSVSFKDNSTDPDGGQVVGWNWDLGDGTLSNDKDPVHTYTVAGTYVVKLAVTNNKGCQGDAVVKNITIHPVPVADFTAPDICLNSGTEQFTNTSDLKGDSPAGFTYSWDFGDAGSSANTSTQGDPQHSYVRAGTYMVSLAIISPYGCVSAVTTKQIVVNESPVVTTGQDLKVLEGSSIILTAAASGNGLSYKWYPSAGLDHDDILNPVASPLNDTKYTLTVTSANGCTNSAQISVIVLKLPKPTNTFTPNGDGINDYWYIDQLEKYPDATVQVFSRRGEKVFSAVGYSVPWDGKYKGGDLPVGVYYYIVTFNSGKKVMSGYVTIVR